MTSPGSRSDAEDSVSDAAGVAPITLCSLAARKRPLLEVLDDAAAAGFEAVECFGAHVDGRSDAELAALRACADDLGLRLLSVAPYLSFVQSAEANAESYATAKRFIGYARALGCSHVRTFTDAGPHGVDGVDATPAQWAMGLDALRWLCAEAPDLTFAVETHRSTLADTVEDCERILNEVDAPNLRLLFQPMGEDPSLATAIAQFDRLLPHIGHVHFSGADGENHACPVEEGERDSAALLRHIAESGYRGPLALEYCWRDPTWEQVAAGAAFLRRHLR